MRVRHTVVMAAALALAACDSSTGPARYSAQGTWSGHETDGPAHLSLTLAQKGDSVFGTGTLRVNTGVDSLTLAVRADGSTVSSNLDLTLTAPRYQPLQITGSFTARNEVDAIMLGSGYFGERILLHRE